MNFTIDQKVHVTQVVNAHLARIPFDHEGACREAAMRVLDNTDNDSIIAVWECWNSATWVPREATCSCCNSEMMQRTPFSEWEHTADGEYAEHRHMHLHHSSIDCDGNRQSSVGITMWGYENPNDGELWDWDPFWSFAAHLFVPFYPGMSIVIADNNTRITWHRTTDEGSESGCLEVCDDPWCDLLDTPAVTDEGLVLDVYDDGNHVATFGNTFDELADFVIANDPAYQENNPHD